MTPARQQVAQPRAVLSEYTTLGLGGPAARFVTAQTERALVTEVQAADQRGEPLLVLGGGSNLVIADDGFDGTVIAIRTSGVRLAAGDGSVTVTAAAGQDWDALVRR